MQTQRHRNVLASWCPALLWMGLIFFLSSRSTLPGMDKPLLDILLKKTGHFVAYGILAWLYFRALPGNKAAMSRKLWIAWGLVAIYALSDEIHQSFVPRRHPAFTDWLIDMVGAATALLLIQKAQRSVPGKLGPR
jgi:VanZ family protein